jgi:dCTP deaminase
MSIIPLVLGGQTAGGKGTPVDDWTVVANQEDFSRAGGVEGHAVLIEGLEEAQLAPGRPNASYDLRIGPEYKDHRDVGRKKELPPKAKIHLLPGAAVIIETEEHVHFPREMFGYIVPKVGLLQRGISNTVSKIDPGYHGPLLVTLFNLGKEKVEVSRRDPFCSVSIHQVAQKDRINLYPGPGKRLEGKFGYKIWQQINDNIEAHHTLAILILALVELVHIGVSLWGH